MTKTQIEEEITRARAFSNALQRMLNAAQDCTSDNAGLIGSCIFIAGELDLQLEALEAKLDRAGNETIKRAAE